MRRCGKPTREIDERGKHFLRIDILVARCRVDGDPTIEHLYFRDERQPVRLHCRKFAGASGQAASRGVRILRAHPELCVKRRIAVVGAAYLSLVCAVPDFLVLQVGAPVNFGGTFLLIAAVTAWDIVGGVSARLIARSQRDGRGPPGRD